MAAPKLDPTKLTPEQQDQLDAWQQQQDQLKSLQDIAAMCQELINVADDNRKNTDQIKSLGAVLTDAREQLVELNKKEVPESPDYAKPVVEALSKLEKALKQAVATQPTIKLDAPQVKVSPPNVDLKGIEKLLKSDLPKAFEKAISLMPKVEIPKPDNKPLLDAWEGISEQLVSIENATRLKPLPGSMTISNLSEVTGSINGTYGYGIARIDDATDPAYYGFEDASSNWYVLRETDSTGKWEYAAGIGGIESQWANRAALTYADKGEVF